jgi:hypothetical protein
VLSLYLLSVGKVSSTIGGDIENASDTKDGFVSKPSNVFKAASVFHKRFFLTNDGQPEPASWFHLYFLV